MTFLTGNYYLPKLEGYLVLHDIGEFFPLLSPAIMSVDLAAQAVK